MLRSFPLPWCLPLNTVFLKSDKEKSWNWELSTETWTAFNDNLRWLFCHFCSKGISLSQVPLLFLIQNKINPFSRHRCAVSVTDPTSVSCPCRQQMGKTERSSTDTKLHGLSERSERATRSTRFSIESKVSSLPWPQRMLWNTSLPCHSNHHDLGGNWNASYPLKQEQLMETQGYLHSPKRSQTPVNEGVDTNVQYVSQELKIKQ